MFMLSLAICSMAWNRIEPFTLQYDPVLTALHKRMSVLHPKLAHIQISAGKASETINKKRVYICLKDENGEYYHQNMLAYVLLHEYAHVLCDEVNDPQQDPHTVKFSLIFKTLLRDAASRGFYNPRIPPLRRYCGVEEK
jgi:hypothetical protein